MIAGAETVVAYPHPSAPAALFFRTAYVVYLPILALWALALVRFTGRRGLNLWLPLSLGILRLFSLYDGTA